MPLQGERGAPDEPSRRLVHPLLVGLRAVVEPQKMEEAVSEQESKLR